MTLKHLARLAAVLVLPAFALPVAAQYGYDDERDAREACRRAASVLVNQEARWDDDYRGQQRGMTDSLRWRAADGTYGTCLADRRGRVYQVSVERWGSNSSDVDVWPGTGSGESSRLLRCESEKGRAKRCPIPRGASVRLVDRVSDAPCVLGRSWNYNRNEIRVDDGCRAVFEVRW